ncbi:Extradiol aromatic ring-opening dioxygenase [Rhizodiscina lignyota]|uniref:Extradiol aromatic ring-opening dioxygenase n=1 Tax=Rhizodiscina lignyota TaxID=1504668 RepID=A0A9P4I5F3_9PEZI|nr:Extradiol aromatic ring-opening dioxygenase [Rhizodiscina lignyota]
MTRGAVIALSHGGGPMPVLGDPSHKEIVRSLKERVPKVLRLDSPEAPRAIVVVTAHWSARAPTISNAAKHELFYDYGGFPPETYRLKYDAPGNPQVAQELFDALKEQGLSPETDDDRGWDHGVFIPLLLIRPEADIPIVQLSVLKSEDPEQHFKMGMALQKLRESNVAIIGSGFASFHNLRLMFSGISHDPEFRKRNAAWNDAINGAVSEKKLGERLGKLKGWREFPGGYEMHPRGGGEHLMPLLVCAGAGGDAKPKQYTDEFLGLDMYSFYWN